MRRPGTAGHSLRLQPPSDVSFGKLHIRSERNSCNPQRQLMMRRKIGMTLELQQHYLLPLLVLLLLLLTALSARTIPHRRRPWI